MSASSSTSQSASQRKDRLIVWLGPPFFSTRLPAYGWQVVRAAHDVRVIHTWESILELTQGEIPDVVVVADASTPPLVAGMERFPCLTLFYAVDSHIHSWYPLYAQGFDICLVSLKDHLGIFQKGRLDSSRVWWTPAYARDEDRPPLAPPALEWDVLFVGTVDPDLTPERYAFITELQRQFPGLHATRGSFTSMYPKARLILNECSHADLNFRVFEALGCGGCLLTPAIGHGLSDLFTHGKDLFVYPQHDVQALLPVIHQLLADEHTRLQVARNGLANVDAAHRASHRAKYMADRVESLFASGEAERMVRGRHSLAHEIHSQFLRMLYLHHAEVVGDTNLQQQYLKAAQQPGGNKKLPAPKRA